MAPTLGYWSIRGRAQPIRFLLAFTNTEYEERLYSFGPPPTFDRSEWLSDKTELGLQFPNLPYFIDEDEDLAVTETIAILRHVARKNSLMGSSEEDMIKIDVANSLMDGMNVENNKLCYTHHDFDEAKEAYVANIGVPLQKLTDLLGEGNYILGDEISYVDFVMYEVLDRFEMAEPGCISAYPNLESFHQRVSELPTIAEYLDTEKYGKVKTRFNARMAVLGVGEYEDDE